AATARFSPTSTATPPNEVIARTASVSQFGPINAAGSSIRRRQRTPHSSKLPVWPMETSLARAIKPDMPPATTTSASKTESSTPAIRCIRQWYPGLRLASRRSDAAFFTYGSKIQMQPHSQAVEVAAGVVHIRQTRIDVVEDKVDFRIDVP